jgi:hypothetical protein
VLNRRTTRAPGRLTAAVANRRSQPIAAANRGSATVHAQGTVDAISSASRLPDAITEDVAPRTATISVAASTHHPATPGATDITQCAAAIRSRVSPSVTSRS